jgi:hypothetical protein
MNRSERPTPIASWDGDVPTIRCKYIGHWQQRWWCELCRTSHVEKDVGAAIVRTNTHCAAYLNGYRLTDS